MQKQTATPQSSKRKRAIPQPRKRLERNIQQDIREALGLYPDLVMFRNSTGVSKHVREDGSEYQQRFGLCVGSSDLIGILSVAAREDGAVRVGRFIAMEVKRPGEEPTDDQKAFLKMVRCMGGFACVVTSVEEGVLAIVRARDLSCME